MNIALILAGGIGNRLGGDIPKQYIKVSNKPIIGYCLDTFANHPMIDCIQIVASTNWHKCIEQYIQNTNMLMKFKGFSNPGENRQLSILNALEDISQYAVSNDLVIIHDAARPLLKSQQVTKCLVQGEKYDGVIPVLPMKDTVYFSQDGKKISSLLSRNNIFAGQSPEVFKLGKYYEANKMLLPYKILDINGSTEPAIIAGMDILIIEGDEENFKITTKQDLETFNYRIRLNNGEGK